MINRLSDVLTPPHEATDGATRWQHALADAITYCAGNILATGFAPELRLRMTQEMRDAQPFHELVSDAESLRVEVLHPLRTSNRLDATVARLRDRLDACRNAANSVYTHFEDNGISVGLVFRIRQLRARILRVRELDYVKASESLGAKDSRIILSHILPNVMAPILVEATLQMAHAILTEAALSYLGVGVQMPIASWGNMLYGANNLSTLTLRPWQWMPPGLCILMAVLSINFIGDGLRDAFDARQKK